MLINNQSEKYDICDYYNNEKYFFTCGKWYFVKYRKYYNFIEDCILCNNENACNAWFSHLVLDENYKMSRI